MNKFFVQILSLVLLLAVMAKHASPFFADNQASITLTGADEGKGKEIEEQKEKDIKEKLFQIHTFYQTSSCTQSIHKLAETHFKYSAYLSLPEIPPDKA